MDPLARGRTKGQVGWREQSRNLPINLLARSGNGNRTSSAKVDKMSTLQCCRDLQPSCN